MISRSKIGKEMYWDAIFAEPCLVAEVVGEQHQQAGESSDGMDESSTHHNEVFVIKGHDLRVVCYPQVLFQGVPEVIEGYIEDDCNKDVAQPFASIAKRFHLPQRQLLFLCQMVSHN